MFLIADQIKQHTLNADELKYEHLQIRMESRVCEIIPHITKVTVPAFLLRTTCLFFGFSINGFLCKQAIVCQGD